MYDYLITTKHTAIMSKQQTAVEFLEICFIRNASISLDEWKTARKMFEQQIMDSHLMGLIHPLEMEATKQAEQYYNENYGS
jgi:hypothetical protein